MLCVCINTQHNDESRDECVTREFFFQGLIWSSSRVCNIRGERLCDTRFKVNGSMYRSWEISLKTCELVIGNNNGELYYFSSFIFNRIVIFVLENYGFAYIHAVVL